MYAYRDGEYWSVVKVLVVEAEVLHLRFYDYQSQERPSDASLNALDWSIGHLPLDPEWWSATNLIHLRTGAVSDDELEGYEMWKQG